MLVNTGQGSILIRNNHLNNFKTSFCSVFIVMIFLFDVKLIILISFCVIDHQLCVSVLLISFCVIDQFLCVSVLLIRISSSRQDAEHHQLPVADLRPAGSGRHRQRLQRKTQGETWDTWVTWLTWSITPELT